MITKIKKLLFTKTNLSIGYAVLFRGLGVLSTFGLSYVIGNYLGAEKAGIYFQSYSVFMIFSLLAGFGLNNTVFIKSSEFASLKDYRAIKILIFKSASIVLLVTVFLIPFLYFSENISGGFVSEDAKELIKILVIGLFPFIILNIFTETLKALKEVFLATFFQSFFGNFIVFLISFYLFTHQRSLKEFVIYFIAVYWILFAILFFILKKKLNKNKSENQRKPVSYSEIVKFSKHLFVISVLSTVLANIDVIILGKFVSKENIGLYGMALKVSLIISFILPALNSVFVPLINEYFVKKDFEKLRNVAVRSSKIMTLFTLPLVIAVIFFHNKIMSFFGNEFTAAGLVLLILVSGQFVRSINASSGFIAMSCGKHRQMTLNLIITFTVHITLMFIIVPIYGIIGAAVVRAISISLQDLFSTFLSRQILGVIPIYGITKIKK